MGDTTRPELPGYDFVRDLGHGGFADVYLYRQHLPSREVAIKVLRQAARSEDDRAQFENEANRMAMLSSHPGIVTIYEVGVAPDDRPYLTMEFCPHDHFGSIARAHPLTVARALEVGIKVSAAVETAHRAAILHRDIKPANILLTTYGEPALTDFGIAGGVDVDEGDTSSKGVSVPFAAPEVLSGSTSGDERSDVYSLGATVYALLAGRSPFSTGPSLTDAELIQRILNAPLPPTARTDVSPTLERVLAHAVARDPAKRYDSAAAFGRALQGIEAELGLAQTPLRIADTPAVPPRRVADPDDDDSTVFRVPQRVDPDGPPAAPAARITGPPATGISQQHRRTPVARWSEPVAPPADGGLADRTVHRGGGGEPAAAAPISEPVAIGGPDKRVVLSVIGALIVAAVGGLLLAQAGGEPDRPTTSTTAADPGPLVVDGAPARPEDVRVEPTPGDGQVVSWSAPSPADGDTYQVYFSDGPADLVETSAVVDDTKLVVDTAERVCVIVETIRAGRVSDASTEVCSP
jgi:serine/threonine protein kinase